MLHYKKKEIEGVNSLLRWCCQNQFGEDEAASRSFPSFHQACQDQSSPTWKRPNLKADKKKVNLKIIPIYKMEAELLLY